MLDIITQNERFVNNKYRDWYIKIISNKITNPLYHDIYGENHHIIPKSIMPEYTKEEKNIIRLSAKEHFICHLLLIKFTKDKDYFKMCKALSKMTHQYNHKRNFTSGYYAIAKTAHSAAMRLNNPSKNENVKLKLSAMSKRRKHSEETKRKISLANLGRIAPNKGKIMGPRSEETKKKISNKKKGNFLSEEHKIKLSELKTGKKRGNYKRHKEYERIQCIHCGISSIPSNINRWHNDKCKNKSL